MFSAISKVAEPLLGHDTILRLVGMIGSENPDDLKFVLVPIIAAVVIAYGVVGGLAAAYWTDLIQGLCIILLSIILKKETLIALKAGKHTSFLVFPYSPTPSACFRTKCNNASIDCTAKLLPEARCKTKLCA